MAGNPKVPQTVSSNDITDLDRNFADLDGNSFAASFKNQSPEIDDPWWYQPEIQVARWNQVYPYQLLAVRAEHGQDGKSAYVPVREWQYTLPMPPESISISSQFAISTTPTLGGIVEEHNGSVFKMISLSGTTGVLPGRGRAPQQRGFSTFEGLAGGTINAVNNIANSATAVKTAISGSPINNTNLHAHSDFEDSFTNRDLTRSTGYYQMATLKRFLERFVAYKKTKEAHDIRLALAIWKDQEVYLVTPVGFEVRKDASSPLEYRYSLSFKAWRRVVLGKSNAAIIRNKPILRDHSRLTQAMNTLDAARRTVQGVAALGPAVLGDIDKLTNSLREVILLAKDTLGAAITLADLPRAIRDNVIKNAKSLRDDALSLGQDFQKLKSTVDSYRGGQSSPDLGTAERIEIGTLGGLPRGVRQQIARETTRVRTLTRLDLETRRDIVRTAADRLASAVGAGSTTFNNTYGQTVPPQVKDEPTESDWEAIHAMNAAAIAMDSLAASASTSQQSVPQHSVDVMQGLARRSGIAFKAPRSKFAVPFPYGFTLEALSRLYLGDPDRWHEIVALNGLRAPYVDEEGFSLDLLTNATTNEVIVDTTDNLFVGQQVWIGSSTVRRTKRHIIYIKPIDTRLAVGLDGDADLDNYLVTDSATLQAFLPDTTNSQQLIYIPSDIDPVEDDYITKAIPGIDEFDPMVVAGGVDLLLDSNNDLVITPEGGAKLAVGLTNIIQRIRIALSVNQGGLLRHPDFGIALKVGQSTADLDTAFVLNAVRRMLSEEPSIRSVDGVKVTKTGPVAKIDVLVTVTGSTQPVPVSFQVQP